MSSTHSIACLLALKKHRECLSFVTKEVKQGTTNADVYILRARLYNFFQKVEQGGQGRWVDFLPVWVLRLQEEARLSTSPEATAPSVVGALSFLNPDQS